MINTSTVTKRGHYLSLKGGMQGIEFEGHFRFPNAIDRGEVAFYIQLQKSNIVSHNNHINNSVLERFYNIQDTVDTKTSSGMKFLASKVQTTTQIPAYYVRPSEL
ncbi:MAG: hypothetical protein WA667_16920 [Candidatus Nitrosopolaris sp.]